MSNHLYQPKPKQVYLLAVSFPEILEAARTGEWGDLPDFVKTAIDQGEIKITDDKVTVDTLLNSMYENPADGPHHWVIRHCVPTALIFSCSDYAFQERYEAVTLNEAKDEVRDHGIV
jgi:hypothetical protein